MDGRFSPPLRGPRFGPRNPPPAATGVGRPLGTPLRAMVDVRGRPARLRWATLDGCAAPPYAVAIEHLFWATPACIRWTRRNRPPTHTTPVRFFKITPYGSVGRVMLTPLRHNGRRQRKTQQDRDLRWTDSPDPPTPKARLPFPHRPRVCVGRLPTAPLRRVHDLTQNSANTCAHALDGARGPPYAKNPPTLITHEASPKENQVIPRRSRLHKLAFSLRFFETGRYV